MKRIAGAILTIVCALTGIVSCASQSITAAVTETAPYTVVTQFTTVTPVPWLSELGLTFDGYNYNVTHETTDDVENYLGTVIYHGFPAGPYRLFSIKGIEDYGKIAVETTAGYLVAIKITN